MFPKAHALLVWVEHKRFDLSCGAVMQDSKRRHACLRLGQTCDWPLKKCAA